LKYTKSELRVTSARLFICNLKKLENIIGIDEFLQKFLITDKRVEVFYIRNYKQKF